MDVPPHSVPRRSLPRRWLNRLEVDRAVFYAISSRAWQFIAGPVSILVIAACFTPELQGYFYTFASLMGIQSLVELGLHSVIINVSSHEWSRLKLEADGRVSGDPASLERLRDLKRLMTRWYALISLLFFVGCGLGGAVFLNQRPSADIDWVAPWFCTVALNALLLWAWAYSSMLEGCNQMLVVNRVRLLQFVTGSFAVWASMAAGWGLWAAVVSAGVRLLWDAWLICVRYSAFWRSLDSQLRGSGDSTAPPARDGVATISWRDEIWPLQWKVAVQGVAAYLAIGLIVPVMFYFHGAVTAGQMGMTWTILTAIESAAFAWVQVRGPLFGMLVARRDWAELDRIFFRLTAISWGFYLLGAAAVCFAVWVLNSVPIPLAQRLSLRLLEFPTTVIFASAFVLQHWPRCQSTYVRAHKQDPYLVASLVSNSVLAVLVVGLGSRFGPSGAAWSYLAVVATINIPWWTWIWNRSRREWHAATFPTTQESE